MAFVCTQSEATSKKKGVSSNAIGTIALGTERGVVTVWDGDNGRLLHQLGQVSDAAVVVLTLIHVTVIMM